QPMMLPNVADQQRKLGFVGEVKLAEPAYSNDFRLARPSVRAFHNQRNLPIIIAEANPDKPFMGCAILQAELCEIPVINSLLAQRAMEPYDQRLILRTNWPDDRARAVLQLYTRNTLRRIG